jgi:hypothetical protein
VNVDPGICGFPCIVEGERRDKYLVALRGHGSECKHIQRFFEQVQELTLQDLFARSAEPCFQAATVRLSPHAQPSQLKPPR